MLHSKTLGELHIESKTVETVFVEREFLINYFVSTMCPHAIIASALTFKTKHSANKKLPMNGMS